MYVKMILRWNGRFCHNIQTQWPNDWFFVYLFSVCGAGSIRPKTNDYRNVKNHPHSKHTHSQQSNTSFAHILYNLCRCINDFTQPKSKGTISSVFIFFLSSLLYTKQRATHEANELNVRLNMHIFNFHSC